MNFENPVERCRQDPENTRSKTLNIGVHSHSNAFIISLMHMNISLTYQSGG